MKNLYKFVLIVLALSGNLIVKSQTLNSYPAASAVILLDFDGQYVAGTNWNSSGPFTANPSGLNSSQITEIFNRVAEDFRPFNINVTTEEAKYTAAPYNRRMRVIITTSYEWYGSGNGGVAFINSFKWANNTPCFVFSSLVNFDVKTIAEIVSHETGHTLNLRHQSSYDGNCNKISDYNPGQGAGEIGWAPIMGVSYSQNMTLWNSGPNSLGCNILINELDVITDPLNGFGYRTDDHTNDYSTATNSTFDVNGQVTINGVIERNDDKDLFKVTMPAFGRLQLDAIPYNVGTGNAGSDLDLQVEFLDGSYTVVGTYNPGNLLSSIMDTFINAGTYYVRVDGKGNIYAPEYGSLGSYSMQATFTDAELLPLRRFELRGGLNGDVHSLNWVIEANEAILKQEIEVSTNGINFTKLDQPNNSLRSYSYRPLDNKPLLYRIHVTLDSYKEHYSNVIAIRPSRSAKPQLIGNMVSGNVLNISSPGIFDYHLIDQNGRLVAKGKIEKGYSSVNTGNIIGGIYIIRFSNDMEQWSEKFIKR